MNVLEPLTHVRTAIVIALHGFKESPDRLEHFSQLDDLRARGEAIIAFPAGIPLDLGFGWNSGARRFATQSADDVGFLSQVIDALLEFPCADPESVHLVGESNGGGMAVRAACDPRMAGRIAGLVLVNPAIDDAVLGTCDNGSPPPSELLAAVGSLDRVVPTDGSRRPFVAVDVWFPILSQVISSCSSVEATLNSFSSSINVRRGLDCARCSRLFESTDGGHTWPGSPDGLNGAPPGSFSLTQAISELVTHPPADCSTS